MGHPPHPTSSHLIPFHPIFPRYNTKPPPVRVPLTVLYLVRAKRCRWVDPKNDPTQFQKGSDPNHVCGHDGSFTQPHSIPFHPIFPGTTLSHHLFGRHCIIPSPYETVSGGGYEKRPYSVPKGLCSESRRLWSRRIIHPTPTHPKSFNSIPYFPVQYQVTTCLGTTVFTIPGPCEIRYRWVDPKPTYSVPKRLLVRITPVVMRDNPSHLTSPHSIPYFQVLQSLYLSLFRSSRNGVSTPAARQYLRFRSLAFAVSAAEKGRNTNKKISRGNY